MRCSYFLERYSDFRDGQIHDDELAGALADHLLRCPQCMRYHARIARGTLVLRTASDLEPSPGFRRALKRRLAARIPEPVLPARAGAITWLLLASALAFLAWEVSRSDPPSAVQARGPAGQPGAGAEVRAGGSLADFTDFAVPAFLTRTQPAARPESAFVAQTAIAR